MEFMINGLMGIIILFFLSLGVLVVGVLPLVILSFIAGYSPVLAAVLCFLAVGFLFGGISTMTGEGGLMR